MTLLNAAPYDARKEKIKRNLLIGIPVAILLLAIFGVTGYFVGHGWFFSDLPAEYKVSHFLTALEAKDYTKAYAIWNNDAHWQEHPDQYKNYPFARFKEDWTTASNYGPIRSHHVDISKRTGTGIIVAVHVNGNPKPMFLWYERSNGTLSYSPLELQY
ncbi:MAG: hypothetical protein ACYC46_04220 [Acidobacteriaceae bacterium]